MQAGHVFRVDLQFTRSHRVEGALQGPAEKVQIASGFHARIDLKHALIRRKRFLKSTEVHEGVPAVVVAPSMVRFDLDRTAEGLQRFRGPTQTAQDEAAVGVGEGVVRIDLECAGEGLQRLRGPTHHRDGAPMSGVLPVGGESPAETSRVRSTSARAFATFHR